MDRYEMNDKIMKIVNVLKTELPDGCDSDCVNCVLFRSNNDRHYEPVCDMLDSLT